MLFSKLLELLIPFLGAALFGFMARGNVNVGVQDFVSFELFLTDLRVLIKTT